MRLVFKANPRREPGIFAVIMRLDLSQPSRGRDINVGCCGCVSVINYYLTVPDISIELYSEIGALYYVESVYLPQVFTCPGVCRYSEREPAYRL